MRERLLRGPGTSRAGRASALGRERTRIGRTRPAGPGIPPCQPGLRRLARAPARLPLGTPGPGKDGGAGSDYKFIPEALKNKVSRLFTRARALSG